jgi:predicted outer membrane protein
MKITKIVGAVALATLVLSTTAACDDDTRDGVMGGGGGASPGAGGTAGGKAPTAPPGEPAGQTAGIGTFSAPEVMNILEVINLGEVAQGQVALQRAQSPEVKAFAGRMVAEHTQALQRMQGMMGAQAQTGAQGQQARIARDPTAQVMQRHDQLLTQDLQSQGGAAVDLAYMTAQIGAHAKVLAMIDYSFMPSVAAERTRRGPAAVVGTGEEADAMSNRLQSELQTMRAAIAGHMVEALQIHQRLRQPAGGAAPNAPTSPM